MCIRTLTEEVISIIYIHYLKYLNVKYNAAINFSRDERVVTIIIIPIPQNIVRSFGKISTQHCWRIRCNQGCWRSTYWISERSECSDQTLGSILTTLNGQKLRNNTILLFYRTTGPIIFTHGFSLNNSNCLEGVIYPNKRVIISPDP